MKWADENDILTDAQFGFRPGYGTTDAIFALHSIINKYLGAKKKLYCCFIDYSKAFDSLSRNLMYFKLVRCGVRCKLFSVIKSMYENSVSCVKFKGEFSEIFSVEKGVLQGEPLSPMLFSLFLNDFENEFIESLCIPVEIRNIALFLLMYADDTIIFSETVDGLQTMLNSLFNYCSKWNLTVNINKTKVVVFRNGGKLRNDEKWTYNGENIEVVDQYLYLGVMLHYNGKFYKTQLNIAAKGRKCLSMLYGKMKNMCLNVETKLYLFDCYISPVLFYGSEIWGFHNATEVEKLHLEFCKNVLKVKKSIVSMMVYSDLGRFPLLLGRKVKIIK